MKNFLILFISIFCFAAQASDTPYELSIDLETWQRRNAFMAEFFPDQFSSRSQKGATFNIKYNESDSLGLPVDKEGQIQKQWIEGRKNMHALLSIKEWKILQHDFKQSGESSTLTLSGEYLNPRGEKLRFEEKHLRKGKITVVATFIYPDSVSDAKILSSGRRALASVEMK